MFTEKTILNMLQALDEEKLSALFAGMDDEEVNKLASILEEPQVKEASAPAEDSVDMEKASSAYHELGKHFGYGFCEAIEKKSKKE